MLCSIGYNESKVRIISGDNSTCPKDANKFSAKDLNYPSMAAQVSPTKPFTINFPRMVTNVGLANSTYRSKIFQKLTIISVKVFPEILSFKFLNEKKPFNVTVTGKGLPESGTVVSATLVWSDGIHIVRSPIVIHTQQGQG